MRVHYLANQMPERVISVPEKDGFQGIAFANHEFRHGDSKDDDSTSVTFWYKDDTQKEHLFKLFEDAKVLLQGNPKQEPSADVDSRSPMRVQIYSGEVNGEVSLLGPRRPGESVIPYYGIRFELGDVDDKTPIDTKKPPCVTFWVGEKPHMKLLLKAFQTAVKLAELLLEEYEEPPSYESSKS
jgi:hypothetical protein